MLAVSKTTKKVKTHTVYFWCSALVSKNNTHARTHTRTHIDREKKEKRLKQLKKEKVIIADKEMHLFASEDERRFAQLQWPHSVALDHLRG